jgi:hypothetical protein
MPAEGPQGIGPLYVSYSQFASQNCNFPICQWKSSPSPPTSIANVGPQWGTLPLCSVSSQRPPCASSAPSALSPLRLPPKNQNGTVETVPPLASCYPLAAISYLSALKTPLPKNPPPTPLTLIPTPTLCALHALAKSRSLQPFSRSSHSQPAAFARSLAPVPQWPGNPSD